MPRKFRALVLLSATVLGASFGFLGGMPSAHAASWVDFCFQWQEGGPYDNQPVYLMANRGNNQWAEIRNGRTGSNGCGWFRRVPTNETVLVRAYVWLDYGWYKQMRWGDTPYWANPGEGKVDLGTGIVGYG